MGLFDKLLGKNEKNDKGAEHALPWIALTSVEQLADIEERSAHKPQFIFKHSTTCGISSMVLRTFKTTYDISEEKADLYYLDLHAHRDVSNEIATKFQLVHQSPQLIIIKDGSVVEHASHGSITELNLKSYI